MSDFQISVVRQMLNNCLAVLGVQRWANVCLCHPLLAGAPELHGRTTPGRLCRPFRCQAFSSVRKSFDSRNADTHPAGSVRGAPIGGRERRHAPSFSGGVPRSGFFVQSLLKGNGELIGTGRAVLAAGISFEDADGFCRVFPLKQFRNGLEIAGASVHKRKVVDFSVLQAERNQLRTDAAGDERIGLHTENLLSVYKGFRTKGHGRGRACGGGRHACGRSHARCPVLFCRPPTGTAYMPSCAACPRRRVIGRQAGDGAARGTAGAKKYFSTALDVFPCLLIYFSTRFPQEA